MKDEIPRGRCSSAALLGALFLVAGMLYERTHNRTIDDYGGLYATMPRFAVVFSVFTIASFGSPGTGNFIGEFLVLFGTSFHSYTMVLLVMVLSLKKESMQ